MADVLNAKQADSATDNPAPQDTEKEKLDSSIVVPPPPTTERVITRDGFRVHPQPTSDPLDPLNWSNIQKHSILAIVMFKYFMFTYITTTTVASFPDLQEQYNISYSQVNWTVAIPALGLAVGPLIFSSSADIFGRRIVFIFGTLMAFGATVGAAKAPSYGGYMAARFFQGLGVSPASTVGLATINDMFYEHERGFKIGLWVLAIDSGLLVGPIIGGFMNIVSTAWVQWLCAILFGVLFILEILFMPETLYPRNKMLLEVPMATATDDPVVDIEKVGRRRSDSSAVHLVRTKKLPYINMKPVPGMRHPALYDSILRFAFTWKYLAVSITVLTYCFMWYWWVLSVITMLPAAYPNYKPQIQGLLFFGLLLGTLFGEAFLGGYLSDIVCSRLTKRNGGIRLPEMRLWLIFPAGLLSAIGLILWGISIDRAYHWMVGQIALFLFAAGIQMGNTVVCAYIVDCYPLQSMSVIAFYAVLLNLSAFIDPRVPTLVPDMLVSLCQSTGFKSNTSCQENYEASNFGAIWTQVLALGNVSGSDGHYVCNSLSSTFCPSPYTLPSNTSSYFGPKPKNLKVPKPSGKRVKVWHGSDFHLDPRYVVGAEANCTSSLCCRPGGESESGDLEIGSSLYGAYKCDSPFFLITAGLESVGPLTGTTNHNKSDCDQFAWSIYTGDLVSHDQQNSLSRNYTSYAETTLYGLLKSYIHSGPLFPVLGNHDSNPEAIDAAHSLPGNLGQQQSWNYEHVAALWQHNNWITAEGAKQARMHYAAYSINHPTYPKLRIITLNTDFWYRSNYLNFINTTNPDNSGQLKFLASELADAESKGERVWILGHVLTGWDGTNPIPNPTDLFYQIIDRFSPHDELMIYYANNGTNQSVETAQTVGWIGPSLTPLNNVNSGYRVYEVDTGDFSVYNAYTYFSNVSSFASLNASETDAIDAPSLKDVDVKALTISIGALEIVDHTRLHIQHDKHYILHGRNGLGKSTVLRALAEGLIPGVPSNLRILLLGQTRVSTYHIDDESGDAREDHETVLQYVTRSDRKREQALKDAKRLATALESDADPTETIHAVQVEHAQRELKQAELIAARRSGARGAKARQDLIRKEDAVKAAEERLAQASSSTPSDEVVRQGVDMLEAVRLSLESMDAGGTDARARTVLLGLGFSEKQIDQSVRSLSGGWQSRCELACALIQSTDILLLDEPTNFLDLPAIMWLEYYINTTLQGKAVVVVTHDRAFADVVADELILLRMNPPKTIETFTGNLSVYEEEKRREIRRMTKMSEAQDRKVKHMEQTIAKNTAAAKRTGDDKKLKQAASRRKKLDERTGLEVSAKGGRFKLNRDSPGWHLKNRADIEIPGFDAPVAIGLPDQPAPLRHPGSLVSLEKVSYTYSNSGVWTLKDVDLVIHPGDRIGLCGLNGSGKSTLINIIMGAARGVDPKPNKGTITTHSGARISCYSQHAVDELEALGRQQAELTALAHITSLTGEGYSEQDVRTMLAKLGLKGNVVSDVPLASLSGGQRVRVALAKALFGSPHLLVLDEVTTHLDADTINALAEALGYWEGALLVVTHDRMKPLSRAPFRAPTLDLGGFINARVIRDHTKRKVFEANEQRRAHESVLILTTLESNLPNPIFPADLEELGYFINENDQIRQIGKPGQKYQYQVNKNDRVNEVYKQAMNTCCRRLVHARLKRLGFQTVRLPLGATDTDPHVPIYASKSIERKKRVIVIFGERHLEPGIFSYRVIGEEGINIGSAIDFAESVLNKPAHGCEDDAPGIIITNPSQLLWYRGGGRAVTWSEWMGLPRESAVHEPFRIDAVKNKIPKNDDYREHVRCVFDDALPKLLHKDAKLDIIGLEWTGNAVLEYLSQHWPIWKDQIDGICFGEPQHSIQDLLTTHGAPQSFIDFLSRRSRAYLLSDKAVDSPLDERGECGCNRYASGEHLYQENIIIRSWPSMLSWFSELSNVVGFEEVEGPFEEQLDSAKMWPVQVLAAVAALVLPSLPLVSSSRLTPPVLPLIVRNPYLSTWLGNARDLPWEKWPMFWTGQQIGFSVMASVAGERTSYPLLGRPHDSLWRDDDHYKVAYPIYNGAQYDASTTNLSYSIPLYGRTGALDITLSFLSPITPTSTVRQSIPASYVSVYVTGTEDVDIYIDLNGQWVSGNRGSKITWSLDQTSLGSLAPPLKTWKVRREVEQHFTEFMDRAEWGTLYFSGPADVRHEAGVSAKLRQRFSTTGTLQNQVDHGFRSIMDEEPVFAFSKSFNFTQARHDGSPETQQVMFTIAHIQDPVVQFQSARGLTQMIPLWKSYFATDQKLLTYHWLDVDQARALASNYSAQLAVDAYQSGAEDYVDIVALSARQVMGATSFSGTPEDPILFLKEISSNGNFQTIDVIFPAFPFFLYTNPRWLAYLLEPLIEHMLSGQYPNKYAMHDLGAHFPNATGHPDGKDEYMPVEECGNILIMGLALVNSLQAESSSIQSLDWRALGKQPLPDPSKPGRFSLATGSQDERVFIDEAWNSGPQSQKQARKWVERSYSLWKQWTSYLVDFSLRPANQLSTDDFAGWLPLQTNLALKGIIGIKAMAGLAEVAGQDADAKRYNNISKVYVEKWEEYGISRDKTHAKVAYNWFGSWTTTYNLYADSLLCFHLGSERVESTVPTERQPQGQHPLKGIKGDLDGFVPKHIYQLQSDWYYAVRQKYGLPLDSRHLYAKTDWEFFAMAVAAPRVRAQILQSVAKWVNETVTDRPLTDLHLTEEGGGFPGPNFFARPVVGGHFAFLTLGQACGGRAEKGLAFLDDSVVERMDLAAHVEGALEREKTEEAVWEL
ncbi:hypothetical protein DV737_g2573, partial [Chaetothyriales sp. CBS 132003]